MHHSLRNPPVGMGSPGHCSGASWPELHDYLSLVAQGWAQVSCSSERDSRPWATLEVGKTAAFPFLGTLTQSRLPFLQPSPYHQQQGKPFGGGTGPLCWNITTLL